jgi:hypothetical protein
MSGSVLASGQHPADASQLAEPQALGPQHALEHTLGPLRVAPACPQNQDYLFLPRDAALSPNHVRFRPGQALG